MFVNEFEDALEHLIHGKKYRKLKESLHRIVTIATGKLTYSTLRLFADQVKKYFPGLTIHIVSIRNDFFGDTITVSGLITGQDLVKQIKERQRAGLELGMKIIPVESGGKDFLEAMTNVEYHMDRDNGNFVYIQAYSR